MRSVWLGSKRGNTAVAVFFAAAFLLVPLSLFSSNMVVLVVGDTAAEELRTSIQQDLNNVKRELKQAAQGCDLRFMESTLSGRAANPVKVLNAAENLPIEKGDVAVFYFTGHGFRVPTKESPWPNLAFATDYNGVDLEDILKALRLKGPRLLLVLADCCNNVLDEAMAPEVIRREWKSRLITETQKKNYRRLFLQNKGEIVISAAEPGILAWSIPRGGVYTLAFLANLNEFVKSRKATVTWDAILLKTKKDIKGFQTPYHLIQLR